MLNFTYLYFVVGEPFKESWEIVNEEILDKAVVIPDGPSLNTGDVSPGFMPNCPPPNVTYNGSLLSSDEVTINYGIHTIDGFTNCIN